MSKETIVELCVWNDGEDTVTMERYINMTIARRESNGYEHVKSDCLRRGSAVQIMVWMQRDTKKPHTG